MKWITGMLLMAALAFAGSVQAEDKKAAFTEVSFKSADGLEVTADLYDTGDKKKPMVVLYHMAHSSRGEYRKIAGMLLEAGFNALAVDQRSGAQDRSNRVVNETAKRAKEKKISMEYGDAYQDMEAALQWVKDNKFEGKIVVIGSSYSSSLVFKLAMDHAEVAGVVSCSPGEYWADQTFVQSCAKNVKQPAFVTCGKGEEVLADPVFNALPESEANVYQPSTVMGHGAPLLETDKKLREAFFEFLKQFQNNKKK